MYQVQLGEFYAKKSEIKPVLTLEFETLRCAVAWWVAHQTINHEDLCSDSIVPF